MRCSRTALGWRLWFETVLLRDRLLDGRPERMSRDLCVACVRVRLGRVACLLAGAGVGTVFLLLVVSLALVFFSVLVMVSDRRTTVPGRRVEWFRGLVARWVLDAGRFRP